MDARMIGPGRLFAFIAVSLSAAPEKLSFNNDIQPLLSEACYSCHGPDSSSRKARLRLDRREGALTGGKSGLPAVVPGKPDESELFLRITSKHTDEVMPPAEAHKTLSPEHIARLRRWIAEGAEYRPHWAFIAPERPTIPVTKRRDWARNDIDRFVLARLEREGLEPSPEADRATLLRRVTYDLTGLPPTIEEVAAFLADTAPHAYERAVERLLARPSYGEHRARYWLDVARYGDTHGLHRDAYRHIWPYRDYVIDAFNTNKPFNQFVVEQLAGDMLPAENVNQLIASAFIRAGISSGEGGTLIEELRVNNQRERVEAFGAAFLGLTTGCAACHDHKFDPLSQKDFYRLTAFFNNLTENPSNDNRSDWPPNIRLPSRENRAAYDRVLGQRAAVQRQLEARRGQARELIAAWLKDPATASQPVSPAGLEARFRFNEQSGATFINSAPGAALETALSTGGAPVWGEDMWFWPSFRMDTSTRLELPEIGDIEHNEAFSVGAWIMPRLEPSGDASSRSPNFGALIARWDSTGKPRGWELHFDRGRLLFNLAHAWPEQAISVATKQPVLRRGRWNHILVTYAGGGRAADVTLYIDGQAQEVVVVKDALAGSVRTSAPLHLGRQHPDAKPMRQSRYQDFRFIRRVLSPTDAGRVAREDYVAEIAEKPMAQWSEDEFATVADFYFAERDPPAQGLVARLAPIEAELKRLAKDGAIALVSEESPQLAYAHVLTRGVYSQRAERVRPAVPAFLPPLPPGAPLDRRGLAEWTVSAANPLTSRVAVNRMWQEPFGIGLVATPEDFGIAGERPSHPELLDWLAVDFREGGWDVKRFYKQIVMSAAYRQAERVTPSLFERDPQNRLIARGPRFRMDAEMLRDTALAASGLLVEKIGGPSVKPYQPAGVWEAGGTAKSYDQEHGEALYRRSLYTFWKRMAPMPNMDVFDAPTRDNACPRRQRTNTPLQSLVLMNDPQWIEAARQLAERAFKAGRDDVTRLDFIGRSLLARPWRSDEKEILEGGLAEFRSTYSADPQAARELVAVGESKPDPAISPSELAAWTLVASTALNIDAVLNK